MSITLTITGNKSILQTKFLPPLNIDDSYECGLLYVSVFNSVPNINDINNTFFYGDGGECIKLPVGAYDIQHLCEHINNNTKDCKIEIDGNSNTLTCSLYCNKTVNFQNETGFGSLLGFPKVKLQPNKWHESVYPINILPLSLIRIECDLVHGSYTNGSPSHIIYEFVPNVPPGHRFVEKPRNIIYYPVMKNNISDITVKLIDLEGNIIDFREEEIVLCLHLRKK